MKDGINRKNLETLAAGLLGEIEPVIPIGKIGFTMNHYTRNLYEEEETHCKTSGCAVGWGPYFGIEKKIGEAWYDYSLRTLIDGDGFTVAPWNWCFSSAWRNVDNSREGAGLRIRYLLEHGLPDNWKAQMRGYDPLCYLPEK